MTWQPRPRRRLLSLLDIVPCHHRRTSSPRSRSRRRLVRLPLRCPSHRLHTSRHCRSDLSIFSRRLACADMVPCIFGLIVLNLTQFVFSLFIESLYYIRSLLLHQFYLLLYCIRFLLLDSYGESITLEVGTQIKERNIMDRIEKLLKIRSKLNDTLKRGLPDKKSKSE